MDQYLPIDTTKQFQNNIINIVDNFMNTLVKYTQKIQNKNAFFKRFGLRYDETHPLLFAETRHNDS